jgi:hypothetical protein
MPDCKKMLSWASAAVLLLLLYCCCCCRTWAALGWCLSTLIAASLTPALDQQALLARAAAVLQMLPSGQQLLHRSAGLLRTHP